MIMTLTNTQEPWEQKPGSLMPLLAELRTLAPGRPEAGRGGARTCHIGGYFRPLVLSPAYQPTVPI